MIKINKSSLQDYQKLTQYIQRNTTLPVLSYLKLEYEDEHHMMTKSNLHSICIASISATTDADYPTLLLDERILFAFIAESKGDDIIVRYNEKQIQLSDGSTEIEFNREDPTNFPKTPELTGGTTIITRDQLASIGIARGFINDGETQGNYQFIHISGTFIAGFHNHFFYVNNRYTNLPDMHLTKEQADLICGSDMDLGFAAQGNHYFFTANSVRYIFTQKEGKTPNIENVLERLKLPGKDFTINKNELISFCSIANIVAETPVSVCTMEAAGIFAKLKLNDENYSRASHRDISITGTFDPFNFNSRVVINALKNIPGDNIACKTNQNCLIITGEREYFCFLGMAPKA